MSCILIVEDTPQIANFISKGLSSNGYVPSIIDNGKDAIKMAISKQFDLVILDLGLPDKNGLSVLNEIRGQGCSVAVIILTGHDTLETKVAAFDRGANDYLAKPFHFEELLVRIRARLHDAMSSKAGTEPYLLAYKDFELNLRTREVRRNKHLIRLSTREFILLETFLRYPGQIMSREQLLDRVWGYDHDPGSNIIDVYVGYLRKKLGHQMIKTVRGMGYCLRVDG